MTQSVHGNDIKVIYKQTLFSLVAHEYGYKGKEIAEYAKKDPAVTRHLKEKRDFYKCSYHIKT
jgi:hypothetical protein